MTTFTFDGHDYTFNHSVDRNVESITTIDATNENVGTVRLFHDLNCADVVYDDANSSDVNYFTFADMDHIDIAKWIAGTSY